MLCQVCGAPNSEEGEFCVRCHHKLLVISAPPGEEEVGTFAEEEDFSLEEHLLERISILEEALKHMAETVEKLLRAARSQERGILVNQAGLGSLQEILERRRLVDRQELAELWKARMDSELLALEKSQRFSELKDRIAAGYRGDRRKLFLKLLEEAEYALYAFDVARALTALESAHRLDRGNPDLGFFIGETHFNEGRTDRALDCFRRVLAAAPDHYGALVYSGVIYQERRQRKRALELLTRAVDLYPDAFLPHFSLGAVWAAAGDFTRATAHLSKAVELDPAPQALFLLGSCYYEMGSPTKAIAALERVVRQDPAFEEAHHLLGLAYLDRRWHRKALATFRRAQGMNPKKMRYQDLVGYLTGQEHSPLPPVEGKAGRLLARAERSLARGREGQTLAAYREAIELAPENPTLLLSYAMACLELDRGKESEALVRRVLDLDPDDRLKATAYATLMETLRTEGRFREGNRLGRRLLEETRSDLGRTLAYYELAYNLAEMEEDLDRALDYAERSLASSPEEIRQFPLAALGWVHYKRGEYERAVEFLRRSTGLGSTPTTLTHLGMALLAAGDELRARRVLARARRLGGRGQSVERKLMECLKDSRRLLEHVRRRSKG